MVETFFKTLKSELVWRTVFLTRAQAAGAIGPYIDSFYNPIRRPFGSGLRQPGRVPKTHHTVSQQLSNFGGASPSVG